MEDLYQKYYLGIRGFIAQKINDEDVVEELSNDVLIAGISTYSAFNHKCSEFSWLCSIAKHKIIDYYRKKKLKTILFSVSPFFEEIADEALSPERDVLKNELKDEIKKTFAEINKGYGQILRLKYIDGFKITEIAEKLEMNIKAVESRLLRAKLKFRQKWNYDKKKG